LWAVILDVVVFDMMIIERIPCVAHEGPSQIEIAVVEQSILRKHETVEMNMIVMKYRKGATVVSDHQEMENPMKPCEIVVEIDSTWDECCDMEQHMSYEYDILSSSHY